MPRNRKTHADLSDNMPIVDILDGQKGDPQVSELAYEFFRAAGGVGKVARMILKDYKEAKPGSMMRVRVMEIILYSLKFVNSQRPNVKDASLLTDEALQMGAEDILRTAMRNVEKEFQKREPDEPDAGAPEPEPGPAAPAVELPDGASVAQDGSAAPF